MIKNRIFSAEILDSGNMIITKKQTIAATYFSSWLVKIYHLTVSKGNASEY